MTAPHDAEEQKSSQQTKGNYSSPLHCICEYMTGVLYPICSFLVQEGYNVTD